MDVNMIQGLLNVGQAGLFLWLYLRVDERLEKQNAKHDADIANLYGQRVNDLKLIARLPTDLEGKSPAA